MIVSLRGKEHQDEGTGSTLSACLVGHEHLGTRMYVLENTTGYPFPTPGTGQIVRVTGFANKEVIASGLFLPTAMTFGPDGALYVSNKGFGPSPSLPNGPGEVLRITVPD